MFTVQLKNLFFKQNLKNLEELLVDQATTYAVLRYAHDIPSNIFNNAIAYLEENSDEIHDIRLMRLVNEYIKATGVGIEFTDEFDHSLEITIGNPDEPFAECGVLYDDFDEE